MADIKKVLVLENDECEIAELPADASTKIGLEYLVKAHNELGEVLAYPLFDSVMIRIDEIEKALELNFYD